MWTEGLEDLLDVDLHRIAGVAGVAEDGAERGAGGEGLDEGLVEAGLEAGGQSVAIDEEDPAADDLLLGDRQGEIDAPVEQDLEQEVLRAAAAFEVVDLERERVLGQLVGLVIDVGEVRAVDFEDAEAGVERVEPGFQRGMLV